MDQKRAFVERWPSRTYKIRDRSITVECNSVTTVCIVSGVVDWTCANPQQRASAKGVASFTLKLSMVAEGRTVIIDENGKLVH
jgi:NADPH-dependent 7-cyano-7-deazaguanine reductase QueF